MDLALTHEELELLREVLEESLVDLRSEVLHTDDYAFRQFLKKKEIALQDLHQKLLKFSVPAMN
jgi:hypothetical protein